MLLNDIRKCTQLAVNNFLQLFADVQENYTPSTSSDVNDLCSSVFRFCATRRVCVGMTDSTSIFIFKVGLC